MNPDKPDKIALTPKSVLHSLGLYPITTLWVVGAGLGVLLVSGHMPWSTALILFTMTALCSILWATLKELRTVHKLVDGQRSELIARIDQLTALLIASGVVVPPTGHAEQTARDNVSPTARQDAEHIKQDGSS